MMHGQKTSYSQDERQHLVGCPRLFINCTCRSNCLPYLDGIFFRNLTKPCRCY